MSGHRDIAGARARRGIALALGVGAFTLLSSGHVGAQPKAEAPQKKLETAALPVPGAAIDIATGQIGRAHV